MKLEVAYARKLAGDRDIRIVWKKAAKTSGDLAPSEVQSTPVSNGSPDVPILADAQIEDST
jgi:hypothetical protein